MIFDTIFEVIIDQDRQTYCVNIFLIIVIFIDDGDDRNRVSPLPFENGVI